MNELMETQLKDEVSVVEKTAQEITVRTEEEYVGATEFTKRVKATAKKVEDYWEPMRKSTYDAYKAVNDHKSQMLKPLKNAEGVLKKKMTEYLDEVERQRKEAEEAARQAALEEAERKMAEAREAELDGDFEKADVAMAEAEVMEQASVTMTVQKEEVKVDGVVRRKDWQIVSIDAEKVPVEIAGIVIRPVDEKAVMALIKATKGKVVIPGVEYKETVSLAVRA